MPLFGGGSGFGGSTSLTRASRGKSRTVSGGRWQGRGLIGTPVGSRLRGRAAQVGGRRRGLTGLGWEKPTAENQARLPRRATREEKRTGTREMKLPRGSRAASHMYAGKPGETYTASTFRLGPKDLQARPTTRKLGWREKVTIADVPGGGEQVSYRGRAGTSILASQRNREIEQDMKKEQKRTRAYQVALDSPMVFPE